MIDRLAMIVTNAVVATTEHGGETVEHAVDTLQTMGHHAADTLHAVAGHAAEAAEHAGGHQPELPNWIELAKILFPGNVTDFLWHWPMK